MIIKDIKSATLWGVILWVFIFVAFSVVMFAPQLKDNVRMQNIIELLILPVLVAFSAYMALKGTTPTLKDGAILGAYFAVVGTILNMIITVPLFVKSYTTFYSQWSWWVGVLETIIFAAVVAQYLGNKPKQ